MAVLCTMPSCFAKPSAAKSTPMNKKPNRGMVHNKDKMPRHVLEIPLPEEEAEPAPKEEIPPYKPPYGIHVESHLADGSGHNPSVKYIQNKVMDALQSSEDFIHRVEVSLHEQEHFHRALSSKRHSSHSNEVMETGQDAAPLKPGLLAPFQMKAVVQMRNHKQIIVSNPEKHAQPTIPEAVDHLADVLRKRVREEKEKEIRRNRKQKRNDMFAMQQDDGADELELIASKQAALAAAGRRSKAKVDDDDY